MSQRYQVRAFVNPDGNGGNLAGVVLNSEALSTPERQAIAKKLNFSETAFHTIEQGMDALEFFTPSRRIDACGHATIAAFGVLSMNRSDGIYPVKISDAITEVQIKGHRIGLKVKKKLVTPLDPTAFEEVKKMFTDIDGKSILNAHISETALPFLVIEIDQPKSLKKVTPDQSRIKKFSDENQLIGFYLFSKDIQKQNHFFSRMFAPAYGIPEESATGIAASCLMARIDSAKPTSEIKITQGIGMKPSAPSEIEVKKNTDEIWIFGSFLIEEIES